MFALRPCFARFFTRASVLPAEILGFRAFRSVPYSKDRKSLNTLKMLRCTDARIKIGEVACEHIFEVLAAVAPGVLGAAPQGVLVGLDPERL